MEKVAEEVLCSLNGQWLREKQFANYKAEIMAQTSSKRVKSLFR